MSEPALPRLRETLGLYVRSSDEIEFRIGTTNGEHIVLSDGERRGLLARVIERLAFPHERELNAEERLFLEELIPQLRQGGLLEEPPEALAPQSLLSVPLTEARLAVVGDGFLGVRLAELLSPVGFRELLVLRSSGTAKTAPRAEAEPRPTSIEQWRSSLFRFDWVIAAQDCFEPEELRAINDERLHTRRPWSLLCYDGREAWIGPTFAPASTACFSCYERRLLSGPKDVRNVLGEPGVRMMRLPQPGLGGAHASLLMTYVASLFAMDVCALMNGEGFTLGSMVVVNLVTMAMQRETVLRIPRCPVCSRTRGEPAVNVFASILPSEPL